MYLSLMHENAHGNDEAIALDAEAKLRKEEQLRMKREEQKALKVKVVKYQINRPAKYIKELFGNLLTFAEEAKLGLGETSKQILPQAGRQRSYSQENLAP